MIAELLIGYFLTAATIGILVLAFIRWFFGVKRAVIALQLQAEALLDIAESIRVLPAVRVYDHQSGRAPRRAA